MNHKHSRLPHYHTIPGWVTSQARWMKGVVWVLDPNMMSSSHNYQSNNKMKLTWSGYNLEFFSWVEKVKLSSCLRRFTLFTNPYNLSRVWDKDFIMALTDVLVFVNWLSYKWLRIVLWLFICNAKLCSILNTGTPTIKREKRFVPKKF